MLWLRFVYVFVLFGITVFFTDVIMSVITVIVTVVIKVIVTVVITVMFTVCFTSFDVDRFLFNLFPIACISECTHYSKYCFFHSFSLSIFRYSLICVFG